MAKKPQFEADRLPDDFEEEAQRKISSFFEEKEREQHRLEDLAKETPSTEVLTSDQKKLIEKLTRQVLRPAKNPDKQAKAVLGKFVKKVYEIVQNLESANDSLSKEILKFSEHAGYESLSKELEELRVAFRIQFNNQGFRSMLKEAGVKEELIESLRKALDDKGGKMTAAYVAQKFSQIAFDYGTKTKERQDKVLLPLCNLVETIIKKIKGKSSSVGIDPNRMPNKLDFTTEIDVAKDGERVQKFVSDYLEADDKLKELLAAKLNGFYSAARPLIENLAKKDNNLAKKILKRMDGTRGLDARRDAALIKPEELKELIDAIFGEDGIYEKLVQQNTKITEENLRLSSSNGHLNFQLGNWEKHYQLLLDILEPYTRKHPELKKILDLKAKTQTTIETLLKELEEKEKAVSEKKGASADDLEKAKKEADELRIFQQSVHEILREYIENKHPELSKVEDVGSRIRRALRHMRADLKSAEQGNKELGELRTYKVDAERKITANNKELGELRAQKIESNRQAEEMKRELQEKQNKLQELEGIVDALMPALDELFKDHVNYTRETEKYKKFTIGVRLATKLYETLKKDNDVLTQASQELKEEKKKLDKTNKENAEKIKAIHEIVEGYVNDSGRTIIETDKAEFIKAGLQHMLSDLEANETENKDLRKVRKEAAKKFGAILQLVKKYIRESGKEIIEEDPSKLIDVGLEEMYKDFELGKKLAEENMQLKEAESENSKKLSDLCEAVKEFMVKSGVEITSTDPWEIVERGLGHIMYKLEELQEWDEYFDEDIDKFPVALRDYVANVRAETKPDVVLYLIEEIERLSLETEMSDDEKAYLPEEILRQRQRHLNMLLDVIDKAYALGGDIDIERVVEEYTACFRKTENLHQQLKGEFLAPDLFVYDKCAELLLKEMEKETSKKHRWYDIFKRWKKKIPEHDEEYMDRLYQRANKVQEISEYCFEKEEIEYELERVLTKVQDDMTSNEQKLIETGKEEEAERERGLLENITKDFSLAERIILEEEAPYERKGDEGIDEKRFNEFYAENQESFWKLVCSLRYEDAADLCRRSNVGREMKYFCKLQSMKYNILYRRGENKRCFDLAFALNKVAKQLGYYVDEPEMLQETIAKLGEVVLN